MAFVPGYFCPVAFTPRQVQGKGERVLLKIVGWNGTEEVDYEESTHAESKGIHACVTGRFVWNGTVIANLDTVLFPWHPNLRLKAGGRGVMEFYVYNAAQNPNANFRMGVRILKINHVSAVAGLVTWSMDVVCNSDEPSGTFLYPT